MAITSIFGQLEELAAKDMIEAGKAKMIPKDVIPKSELFDKQGREASFAISLKDEDMAELERRIAEYRW